MLNTTPFPYRYIQDVMFSYLGEPGLAPLRFSVGLRRAQTETWPLRSAMSRDGIWRWVAPEDEGVIDGVRFIENKPFADELGRIVPDTDPICDGMSCYMIFDAEPDRSVHPRSLRDLRIQWGEPWEDDDNEIPWWRKRPSVIWIRRRVKRAKMFAEQSIWVQGRRLVISLSPLDPRDDCC